jgi:hypothetical protein
MVKTYAFMLLFVAGCCALVLDVYILLLAGSVVIMGLEE